METRKVSSSNISSIGYDASSQILEIRFLNGGIYQYYNVPSNIYNNLMTASSHGKYFAAHIKNIYRTMKLK